VSLTRWGRDADEDAELAKQACTHTKCSTRGGAVRVPGRWSPRSADARGGDVEGPWMRARLSRCASTVRFRRRRRRCRGVAGVTPAVRIYEARDGTAMKERTRGGEGKPRGPGGAQGYQEHVGGLGLAGGGRGWPESAKNCGDRCTESASLATTRGAQARFLRGGEPGQRGGALGALGLERGGRNRRGAGELLTVVFSQIRKGGRGWWRR
jgi:hypothetical protein